MTVAPLTAVAHYTKTIFCSQKYLKPETTVLCKRSKLRWFRTNCLFLSTVKNISNEFSIQNVVEVVEEAEADRYTEKD